VIRLSGPVDGVATITLDRPDKRNALSIALRDAVSDVLEALGDDDAVRCVVVTGSGGVFSAGFDLGEFTSADADVLWASSDRFHHTVLRFPVPTIAMVNGPALAGGFDLALLCDLRVAAPGARFAHPEQRFGDVIYSLLHDLVGGAVARDLCFTGRAIDADEALRLGIVSRVAESCDDLAAEIAAAPRDVLVRTKAKAIARSGIDAGTRTLDL
jgi:enoyl-CoA hydratase/carnithine racemase